MMLKVFSPKASFSLILAIFSLFGSISAFAEGSARDVFNNLVLEKFEDEEAALDALTETGDPLVIDLVESWKVGEILTDSEGAVIFSNQGAPEYLLSGDPFSGSIDDLEKSRASRSLRKKLRKVTTLLELSSADYKKRKEAVYRLANTQNEEFLEDIEKRIEKQPNTKLKKTFQSAVSMIKLKHGTPDEQYASIIQLGDFAVSDAKGLLIDFTKIDENADDHQKKLAKLSEEALAKIKAYDDRAEFIASIFRGLSTGSVLLIVSYGLAITFGLMGVINMAHGEFIAVGAYTSYVVQNMVIKYFAPDSGVLDYYFLIAIPIAFLVAGLLGAILERGVIQFLYKRPLESLLATWGVSMVMQQGMKSIFGAANVQVASPSWMVGNSEFFGASMSYNRQFIILCSVVVVILTWILLNRSKLGLHIRATMQNRNMASAIGIPSSKVNMMTFAYGSGLAGVAGALISQIGNVGYLTGQAYIVDSFMVVVAGGVGNLLGAIISSLGIGVIDQILQPYVGPVMGKIIVLFAIILFLQWRPSGLFASRSRSLDD